jgi:hypothetical protein
MASNFQISSNRTGDSLHLELSGDFDGTSAHELLYFLEKYNREISVTYIHTGDLRQIYTLNIQGSLATPRCISLLKMNITRV